MAKTSPRDGGFFKDGKLVKDGRLVKDDWLGAAPAHR
jgi:hypothetical protein